MGIHVRDLHQPSAVSAVRTSAATNPMMVIQHSALEQITIPTASSSSSASMVYSPSKATTVHQRSSGRSDMIRFHPDSELAREKQSEPLRYSKKSTATEEPLKYSPSSAALEDSSSDPATEISLSDAHASGFFHAVKKWNDDHNAKKSAKRIEKLQKRLKVRDEYIVTALTEYRKTRAKKYQTMTEPYVISLDVLPEQEGVTYGLRALPEDEEMWRRLAIMHKSRLYRRALKVDQKKAELMGRTVRVTPAQLFIM